jgi:hypothetical protein
METSRTRSGFTGPYREELAQLSDLLDWLWTEHGLSFVKAGDDKVYAFGGNGHVIVFDEAKWDGLIEIITPNGTASIKKNDSGDVVVTSSVADEEAAREIISNAVIGLRKHYETRYWTTPKAS